MTSTSTRPDSDVARLAEIRARLADIGRVRATEDYWIDQALRLGKSVLSDAAIAELTGKHRTTIHGLRAKLDA